MMNKIKQWPFLAIILAAGLALAAGGAALWFWHGEQTAQASELPSAARIDRVSGDVGLNRGIDSGDANTQWVSAEQNTPISVGDRIYTKDNSDASIAFTGRNFARLNADTSLDVLSLSEEKTQVALRDGSGVFDIGSLASGDLFEVATPCGALDLTAPGLYQVGITESGNATATAFSGSAQVLSQTGSGRIEKGEELTVPCNGSSSASLSQLEPRAAGTAVDQYYRYRYPRSYDGRYANYQSYVDDPFYYDPGRRLASYQYVSDYIPGIDDLDYYGDWQNVSEYGQCWRPRVDSQWAPYQSGYWSTEYPYGLTWISTETWGYAPYHYGRWAYVSNNWFWVPDRVRTRPVYSPALVAFIPFGQRETIGWVPLGPGDPYSPRYYDRNWSPRFLTRSRVNQERVINLNVPGAVTVVNLRDFNRPIDHRMAVRVDEQELRRARPVLDPFSVRSFRDAAVRPVEARRRFDVSSAMAQHIARPVVTSTLPVTPIRKELAQNLHVQAIPEAKRQERFQVRDNRQAQAGSLPATTPVDRRNLASEQDRERRIADLSREAARGNRSAREQMQQLRQQQRQELRALPGDRGREATQQRSGQMPAPAAQQTPAQAIRKSAPTRMNPVAPQPHQAVTDQRLLRRGGDGQRNNLRPRQLRSIQSNQRPAPGAARQNMRQQQPRSDIRGNVRPTISQPPAPQPRPNMRPRPEQMRQQQPRANVMPAMRQQPNPPRPPNIRQRPEQMRQQAQPKAPPSAPRPAAQPQKQPPPQQEKGKRHGP